MESKSTSRILRRKISSYRYYPYNSGSDSGKKEMKEEVIRLGVKFSVSVAESMFLLCDDTRTLLFFCLKLWRHVIPERYPVIRRLILVIYYVYSKHIRPRNGVCQNGEGKSAQWNLIMTTWNDFVCGIVVLHRLVHLIGIKDDSFDEQLLSLAIAKYKQEVENLEDKLKSGTDVSEANGFARETIETKIFRIWKPLFDEEASKEKQEMIKNKIFKDMFEPIWGVAWDMEIANLPLNLPYILGKDFAKQELEKETVQLGVELSLYLTHSMFLLCDDIRSLLWFCFLLHREAKSFFYPNSPVLQRLLRVIHYVYSKDIQPKNNIIDINGISVQWRLVTRTLKNFAHGISFLDMLVSAVRGGGIIRRGRDYTSMIEEELKQLEEKLGSAKTVSVSEENGFKREEVETFLFSMWKSLFDIEAKEARESLKAIEDGIIHDLFLPLY